MKNNKNPFLTFLDEEIIALIRQGDLQAQEYLMGKYKPLVRAKARTYFLAGADQEDIIQEGMIGLYKAVRDYQPERQASFFVFADLCINRQIITAVKSATRQKHIPLNTYISLNKQAFEQDADGLTYLDLLRGGENDNPETVIIGQESKSRMESNMGRMLSKFEAKVLTYYLQGKSYVEIAKLMEKPEKSIDNALQRMKRKLEKFLTEKA